MMNKGIINIYGDITDCPFMEGEYSAQLMSQKLEELKDCDEITVNINSMGGSVAEGLAIYNQLTQHPAKITTVANGFACSIASLIFMAGDTRIMTNASLLMVHNAWTMTVGNANELRKQADDLEKITQASINVYMEKTGLDESTVKELLDNETWLDANEALELGFVTEIANEKDEVVAQSVKMSLISMIKEKCKPDDDKKKKCEDDNQIEQKVIKCPECDYEGEMSQDEDGDYICPKCGAKIEVDTDTMDKCGGGNKDDKKKKKQGAELNAMSSFLNLFK